MGWGGGLRRGEREDLGPEGAIATTLATSHAPSLLPPSRPPALPLSSASGAVFLGAISALLAANFITSGIALQAQVRPSHFLF